eukprot:SAG31_NODE_14355_length_811_cov_2.893258_1_plen_78_part_01
MGFARYRKRLLNCTAPNVYQVALDPSGTSSCLDSWGSSTADYCTWHERTDNGWVFGVLCGGCTASEEPSWLGNVDYLG